MDLNDMIRDFQVLAGKQLDYAAIADSEKKIFISVGDKKWEKQAVVAAASDQMNTLEAVAGGTGFVKTSLNSKWRVISYVADKTIFMSFSFYVVGIMTVLFLFTLVTLGILSKAIGNILKPLSELSGSMEEVAKGNLDCKLTQFPEDEIGMLSRTFNQMTVDLKDSLELLAKKERQEQQIRFSLLISQIDPHFIYNTINSINYLARRGRCNDVIKVNSALISILQDRLRVNDIQVTDTIANERKVVEQYLVIERYMYDGDLEVAWKIENELMTEQIPKNMIQPLVENALFHGLIDEESGELNGKIEIEIQRDEKDLILRVSDNGIGMSEDRLKAVREEIYQPEERGKKIGLSNIGRRLYYLYGSSDGIRIESGENEGTRITLKFKGEYFEEH
ncbi:sensor histidine kinase, partial [[Clostridium] scindens]